MRIKLTLATLLVLMCLILSTGVVNAQSNSEANTGTAITQVTGEMTFAVKTPFYISHSWRLPLGVDLGPVLLYGFSLKLDGRLMWPNYYNHTYVQGDSHPIQTYWTYDFPRGMTGKHTFTMTWTGPCKGLLNLGYSVTCRGANQVVKASEKTLTIDFVKTP